MFNVIIMATRRIDAGLHKNVLCVDLLLHIWLRRVAM
jgi:hypothetical protein